MSIKKIWEDGIRLMSIVAGPQGTKVNVSMPELDKVWEWRKQPDCYHMPTFGTEENLLASIGINKEDEHICIDRQTFPKVYRYCAVSEVYTVYLMTNEKKYKIAEYVRTAGRPLLYLTRLWRLSIGLNSDARMANGHLWHCKRICIHSTQLMDLAFWGYRFLFESNKGDDPRHVVIRSRVTKRYTEGTERFNRFWTQTQLAALMMLYREEATSATNDVEETITIDFELYKFWRRCKKVANRGIF